jgi:polyketide synthase PksJ
MDSIKKSIASLSGEKRELLLKALRSRKVGGDISALENEKELPIISPLDDQEFELTASQQRIWFLSHIHQANVSYNCSFVMHWSESVSPKLMQRSIDKLIARHDILRTKFSVIQGQPVQRVTGNLQLPIQSHDLRPLSPEERMTTAMAEMDKLVRLPFDLENGPLLRVMLIHLDRKKWVLVWCLHHIICDGSSLKILQHELRRIYRALRLKRSIALSENPVQYKDFVEWQKKRLLTAEVNKQWQYWEHRLANAPTLNLPTQRPRPLVQTYAGARIPIKMSQELTSAVREFARERGTTAFVVLLAGFKLLLSCYSGQDDIVVGVPTEGRILPEHKDIVGVFINTIVLRSNLEANSSFLEFVDTLHRTVFDALTNQEVPFEHLLDKLKIQRDPSRNPIFQCSFQLFQYQKHEVASESEMQPERATAKIDLAFEILEYEDRFGGRVEYNTDLFDQEMIEQMLAGYMQLLEACLRKPQLAISSFDVAGEDIALPASRSDEDRNILALAETQTYTDLFATSVRDNPDKTAVSCADKSLSYIELDRRSSLLANHLLRLGVGPEKIVAICMERSLELLVVLLGILKAGAAYLPLDPQGPRNRTMGILEDASVSVVVTQSQSAALFDDVTIPTVFVDGDDFVSAGIDCEVPVVPRRSNHLAYVIYTSGSTGTPKGVQIAHRSLTNCLLSMIARLEVKRDDQFLAITALTFDIAALELLMPLIVGASVLIAHQSLVADGAALARYLQASEVSMMQATPATWRLLLDAGWRPSKNLVMLCGGEKMPWPLALRMLEFSKNLWNVYGPTEATIWVCARRVNESDGQAILSGDLANLQLYILDHHLRRVPIGATGEIFISGACLSRGYVNRPELTAEKFVTGFAGNEQLMYRTGDLGRWIQPGEIEFIGRMDSQVKLRGFRIELDEIEAVLRRHPEVSDAVVLLRNQDSDQANLMAYAIRKIGSTVDMDAMQEYLRGNLPSYMCPPNIFFLQEFPLNSSGKVDRKVLSNLKLERQPDEAISKAQGLVAEWLEKTCKELLRVDDVSMGDNFFQAGGNSLLVIRILSRIRDEYKLEVPLVDFFLQPTLGAFAEYLNAMIKPVHTTERDIARECIW